MPPDTRETAVNAWNNSMLTDPKCKNAKPKEKPYKLADEKALYLEVMVNGSKYWRFKYRYNNKEKRLALGVYPEVSLKEARDKRDEARKLLASGVDPAENRKAMKAAQVADGETFEVIAREWFAKKKDSWAQCHSERILRRLEANVFPWLGNLPIANIDAPKLLAVLHRIERRGAIESAHRMLQTCGQIFRYAIATGRTERDLSVDLRGALSPVKSKNFAAITEPDKIKELLQAIDAYPGSFIVQCGLKLAPLIFVRPGELRMAEWQDFNFDTAEWRYITSKTKTQHIVPLATQAITILGNYTP